MERNCLQQVPPAPASLASLNRTNLDTLASTAENDEYILCRSVKSPPDHCVPWTNEKHSLYLDNLEVSFVKHLHQSTDWLVQSSESNHSGKSISRKRPANIQIIPEQCAILRHDHCQRISSERDKPFSHVSSDPHNSQSSPATDNFRHIGTYYQPVSADKHQFLKLCCAKKHVNGEVIFFPEFATCSNSFSACKSDRADSSDLLKEGTGQNFVNEDNSYNSHSKSQAKKPKTGIADWDVQEIP